MQQLRQNPIARQNPIEANMERKLLINPVIIGIRISLE